MSTSGSAYAQVTQEDTVAVVLLLASVLALATGNVLIKPVIPRQSVIPFCALQFLAGGLAALVAALLFEPAATPAWEAIRETAAALAFLALVGSIAGTLLWFHVLRTMTANSATSFFLLTPIIGTLLGALIFGEPVTGSKILGIFVISAAIALRLKEVQFVRATTRTVSGSDPQVLSHPGIAGPRD